MLRTLATHRSVLSATRLALLAWLLMDAVAWAQNGNDAPPPRPFPAPESFLTALETWETFPRTWYWGESSSLRVRGRVDTDFIATSQSAANIATFGNLGDATGLRRARIGVEGKLSSESRYIAEIDMASGQVVPRDVFIGSGEVTGPGERRAGHFREPFSLEGGTSANTFAFLERSPINLLDPARNWGLGLYRAQPDDRSTLSLGVFHAGTDAGDFQGGDGATVGFTGRLTMAPINEGNGERLLHFGIALSERLPESGVVIINQQPRSSLIDLGDSSTSTFVPVIMIPATFQQLINLQTAGAYGPAWAQAEWYGTFIDQIAGGAVYYHGCHADCGYFLTGEHREYLSQSGVFGPLRVNHPLLRGPASRNRVPGWGAWELTSRFAYMDLFDSDAPLAPSGQLVGVKLTTLTCGVNWYLADHVRLLFNYNYELPVEPNSGTSVANIYAMRLNVFW